MAVSASNFAALCKKSRKITDDHYSACCPAHDDSDPSLDIKDGDNKLLLHCYAGCDFADICEAVGVKQSDTFLEKGQGLRKIDQEQIALDKEIVWLFETLRKEKKEFSNADENCYMDSKLRLARQI